VWLTLCKAHQAGPRPLQPDLRGRSGQHQPQDPMADAAQHSHTTLAVTHTTLRHFWLSQSHSPLRRRRPPATVCVRFASDRSASSVVLLVLLVCWRMVNKARLVVQPNRTGAHRASETSSHETQQYQSVDAEDDCALRAISPTYLVSPQVLLLGGFMLLCPCLLRLDTG
jgi:hypothetical protein